MTTPYIVIITIVCYFALLLGVGRLSSRRAGNSTFFSGERRAPWPLVAFAMIGAAISGVTFISVPGMVVGKGYAYLQMVLGFIVGYVVIAYLLVPLFYKRNLVSIYGYLEERFGRRYYKAGAWMFMVSKLLGASVRFFVVCAVLQLLVFDVWEVPFAVNVAVTIGLIWLYTSRGGVKTLIWTDVVKSACLILSVVLCIYYISRNMGIGLGDLPGEIGGHGTARMWHFDDVKSASYFWKQFVAGVFMAIATNGLDQDMMQRHLACRDSHSSRKNMILSGVMQFFVIAMFLFLGTLLMIYCERGGIDLPAKSDELFGMVAWHQGMPVWVGVLFVLGLISAAYSAAGSALTSLTTSMTIDILDGQRRYGGDERKMARVRRRVHVVMSALMACVIIAFYYMSSDDAISAVYMLASYTYGPILGLFAFGMVSRRRVDDRFAMGVVVGAPALSWIVAWGLERMWGYETSFELLLINAAITIAALGVFSKREIYVEESV